MKVQSGQTIVDIAVQEYGTLEGMMVIAVANDLSVTADVDAGSELIIPSFDDARPNIVRKLKQKEAAISSM